MKRFLAVLLVLMLSFALASCAGESKNYGANPNKGMLAELPRYEGEGQIQKKDAVNYALVCEIVYTGITQADFDRYRAAFRERYVIEFDMADRLGFEDETLSGFIVYDEAQQAMKIAAFNKSAAALGEVD